MVIVRVRGEGEVRKHSAEMEHRRELDAEFPGRVLNTLGVKISSTSPMAR
jgi:hypothetical protein